MALIETIKRQFYVKGSYTTNDITTKLMADSIDRKAFDKHSKKVNTTCDKKKAAADKSLELWSTFSWYFLTDKDAKSNNPDKRVAALEGYYTDELTDDEKWELHNIGLRRNMGKKATRMIQAVDDIVKVLRQQFKYIDENTATQMLSYCDDIEQIRSLCEQSLTGDKLEKGKVAKRVASF
jgi:hypothetical protein